MKPVTIASAALACITLVASPAGAANGSYFVSAKAMAPLNAASPGANLIILPDTPGGSVHFSVDLPADYTSDTPVKIRLRLRQIGTACTVKFSLAKHSRWRIGKPTAVSSRGISPVNGLTATIGNDVAGSKTFIITGLSTGSVRGLRAGDIIVPEFIRDSASADDTCTTPILLDGAEILYRRK